ncbi:MAG: radical SAM protein [archaeon]|nr:radical SAM protein [archaeon]
MELIEYGQKTGFVMGMLSNGIKFADPKLVKDVVKKGLDYIQITIHSHDSAIHNRMVGTNNYDDTIRALKNIEKEDLFFMTTTTLTKENIETIEETIRFLNELNVKVFACNGLVSSKQGKSYIHGIEEEELKPVLEKIEMIADELDMQFIWYSPTQFATSSLVDDDFEDTATSAANSSITVEPNGNILPCQTIFESAGNIFKNDWEDIWESNIFKMIRKNEYTPPKVDEADLLTICNGGSPLHLD